ncbi:hypothetical protein GCM10010896_12810 [Mammaliicoccus stepanovicii]|nr:hypothetical protein GCM10010896_12810 [Mammaliicoccus stepanovicii]
MYPNPIVVNFILYPSFKIKLLIYYVVNVKYIVTFMKGINRLLTKT